MALTFAYLDLTGVTETEILARAKKFRVQFNRRFGPNAVSLQDAIDGAIDAAVEANQG